MYFILYVSTAEHRMDEQQLLDILKISRHNNEAAGITGMLLYKESARFNNGSFMQVLEGDKPTVMATYNRIIQDKRHHTILPLESGSIEQRRFADWSMGFRSVNAEDLKRIPGFADLGDRPFYDPGFIDRPDDAIAMMQGFCEDEE